MLINIFGKRGAGKTTTIKGQLNNCRGPVVVIDILGNYEDEEYIQCEDASEAIEEIKYYLENPDEKNKIIVCKAADPGITVDYLSAAMWEACQGTLVLDEADAFKISEAPCFEKIIRYGRNKNVDLITGVRRPAELDRNISAGANKMYVFGTHEPRDIEYYEKTILGERAEELKLLPSFTGIFIDYDKGLTGKFRIDKQGRIFHTEEVAFK